MPRQPRPKLSSRRDRAGCRFRSSKRALLRRYIDGLIFDRRPVLCRSLLTFFFFVAGPVLSQLVQVTHDDLAAHKGSSMDASDSGEPLVSLVASKIALISAATLASLDSKSRAVVQAVIAKTSARSVRSLREAARVFLDACAARHSDLIDADTFYTAYSAHLQKQSKVSKESNIVDVAASIGDKLHKSGVHSRASDAFPPHVSAAAAAAGGSYAGERRGADADSGNEGEGHVSAAAAAVEMGDVEHVASHPAGPSLFSGGSTLSQSGVRAPVVSTANASLVSPTESRQLQAYMDRHSRGGGRPQQPSALAAVAANIAHAGCSGSGGITSHETHLLTVPVALSAEELLNISSVELFGEAMIDELGVNRLVWNTALEKLVNDGSTLKDMSLDESIEQLFRHLTSVLLIPSGVANKICRLIFAMKRVNHPFF